MSDETFDLLWAKTGFADHAPDVAPDVTLRASFGTSARHTQLPHLSIGELSDDGPANVAQLIVQEALGAGGMGIVHSARQPLLDRNVAIKRVRPGAPARAASALLREARYMGSLEHPNIIPVHTLGADDEQRPILVMKRIEGIDWRTLIRQPDHPAWAEMTTWSDDPIARNVEILVDVCRAIHFAHCRGVLHRDLKPENVMVGQHGEVYVLDWGVAMRIDAGGGKGVVGTPAYMAPEMVDVDAAVDVRTDVYLLGACLHEVLTGQAPHSGASLEEVMRNAHLSAPSVYDGDLPPLLVQIAGQARSADPRARHADVAELQRALMDWLRHRGSERLAAVALEQVEALRGHIEAGRPAEVTETFTECRFGFRHALEVWSDNPTAQKGRREAVRLMAGWEIQRENLDHARALLDELEGLGEAVASLRGELAAASDRLAIQRDAAEALDLERGKWQRAGMFAFLALVGLVITVSVNLGVSVDPDAIQTGDLVFFGGLLNLAGLFVLAIGWRHLTQNTASQVVMMAVSMGLVGILLQRVLGHFAGAQVPHMFAVDCVTIGAVAAVCYPVVGAWTLTATAFWWVLAVVIVMDPTHAGAWFGNGAAVGMIAVCVLAWTMSAPRRAS